MNIESFITSLYNYFLQKNISCEYDKLLNNTHNVKLFAKYSKGRFFRKNYYINVYDCSSITNDNDLINIHESARNIINSYYKTPKYRRINIPIIVSIFVANRDISKDLTYYISNNSFSFIGGERNHKYFFDINNLRINDTIDIKYQLLSERFEILVHNNHVNTEAYNSLLDLVFFDFLDK